MPHVTEKLHQDHEKVEQMFKKLQQTSNGAEKTRQKLCQQLATELRAHMEFEEKVFYPALRQASDGAGDKVKHAFHEHNEAKQMLEQLEQCDPKSDEFLDIATQLQEAIEHHVREEEDSIFDLAQDRIEDDDAEQMAVRHDKMAQEYKQQHASR